MAHDYWNNKKLSSILLQSLTGGFICIWWLRKLPAELHVLDVCLEQVRVICPLVYSSLFITAEMTHRYTKSTLQTPRKGLFTLITKPQIQIQAPSTPPSSEDDLQGLQRTQWIRAGLDEIHEQELSLHHDLSKNPSASRWYKAQRWRTGVLEHLWTMESTITVFPRNKLLADTSGWSVTFRIFV